jgi:hypothetical protein
MKRITRYSIAVLVLSLAFAVYAATQFGLDPSLTGTYLYSPSFTAETGFELKSLEDIETTAKSIILACGDQSFSDIDFENCLNAETAALNNQDPSAVWSYGIDCSGQPFEASDRKAVFCVLTDQKAANQASGWSRDRILFRFALDFSQDAVLTANGQKPPRCMDGTDFKACSTSSPGTYCDVDLFGDYYLKSDCRGIDPNNPDDDCGCGSTAVCRSDGTCELTI